MLLFSTQLFKLTEEVSKLLLVYAYTAKTVIQMIHMVYSYGVTGMPAKKMQAAMVVVH